METAVLIVALIIPAIASALATWLVLGWLRRGAMLDHPNERSSHAIPTPRGGGLAAVSVILVSWAILALSHFAPRTTWPIIALALLLMIVSWIDDRRGVSPPARLAVHFFTAIVGISVLPDATLIFQGVLPFWADRAVAVLAWVWFVNLYNFMDGIDGITASETALIGIGLTVASMTRFALPAIGFPVAGAAIGFLVWNRHPARIFLGDVGSVPLGFLTGWLLIEAAIRGQWEAAIIMPAYYWADATITLFRRALAGERIWQAHRSHFYQRALQGGASHDAVVSRITIANLLLLLLTVVGHGQPILALAAAAIVVAVLLYLLDRMGRASPSPAKPAP